MTPAAMKVVAVVLFVACAVLLFVAWERYDANRGNVAAVNRMMGDSPLGPMIGQGELRPAMPAVTKYALLFAVICGGGGVVLLVVAAGRSKGAGPANGPQG